MQNDKKIKIQYTDSDGYTVTSYVTNEELKLLIKVINITIL
jgi:hypothetical protein